MFGFFKKTPEQKAQIIEDTVSQWNVPLEEKKIQPTLIDNITVSKQIFSDMDIIRYRTITKNEGQSPQFFLIFCDGLVNVDAISQAIIKPLLTLSSQPDWTPSGSRLQEIIQVGELSTTDSFRCVVESVTSGDTILFADGCQEAMILDTKQWALRSITEPDNEKALVGPREGFTESLMQNLSQVIRRIRTNEFKTKFLQLGRRTKTPVCVCYFDSLVDKALLEDLMSRISGIDIDGILDTHYITELIQDNPFSSFRTIGYTERPDTLVGKLLEGRIAVFVDGSPVALTLPYLFIENFQSSEDYYLSFYYTSFSRLLRIGSFLLSITIPGLYIAIESFHPEMLPLQLLIQIAFERQNVPLPAALEAVVLLVVFDILRETGIRMPSQIGQALSIVGALVIGQAAVEANLVASPMIIVVASTGITSLLVPKLNAPVIIWRYILLVFSSTFGFFGFTIAISIMIIHINNLTSLGVEETALIGSFQFQNIKDIFIRVPWRNMKTRPERLTANKTRLTGGDDNG